MKFTVDQHLASPPARVAEAFADPDLYRSMPVLPKLSLPELLSHEVAGGVVELRIRYRFEGHLSSAVTAVIDPSRLSWVEHSSHHLAAGTGSYTLQPDHYGDRFRCAGTFRYEPSGDGCRREITGDLRVRAPLVAGTVERAIVSGLRENLEHQAAAVDAYLARQS